MVNILILLFITTSHTMIRDEHAKYKWAPIGNLKQPYIVFMNNIFDPTWTSMHQVTKRLLTKNIYLPVNSHLSISCGICKTNDMFQGYNVFSRSKLYLLPNDTNYGFDDTQVRYFNFQAGLNICIVINKITQNPITAPSGSKGEILCKFNDKYSTKLQYEIVNPKFFLEIINAFHCPPNLKYNSKEISNILKTNYNYSQNSPLLVNIHRQRDNINCKIYSFLRKDVVVYNFQYKMNDDNIKTNKCVNNKFFNPLMVLLGLYIYNLVESHNI